MPAKIHLLAYKRVPFVEDIAFLGPDWTGAPMSMHIRYQKGDTGVPLIALANAPPGSQGLSVAYNAAYVYNDLGAVAPASSIFMRIDETTIEAISLANPTNANLLMFYDIHVTPVGFDKILVAYGTFTIDPGATI